MPTTSPFRPEKGLRLLQEVAKALLKEAIFFAYPCGLHFSRTALGQTSRPPLQRAVFIFRQPCDQIVGLCIFLSRAATSTLFCLSMPPQLSFSEAIRPHYPDVVRYCRWLCAAWSPSDAQDVLQQALLRVFEHYDDLADINRFKPWLYRIVQRTYLMEKRRRFWQRFLPLESPAIVPQLPVVYPDMEQQIALDYLQQALAELPDRARVALLLYEVAGFSVAEIADLQRAASTSAIKSRLSRARSQLRDILTAQGYTSASLAGSSATSLTHDTLEILADVQRNA